MAELADALDSKSSGTQIPCGFDSLYLHFFVVRGPLLVIRGGYGLQHFCPLGTFSCLVYSPLISL
jgi:hypothetical protein